ncbi:hypothetical protein QZH41_003442 [Actinostola sp. cb2023]|nr:hypothetical protein QZH41_003442 [Actinostola sp. cb2023]
MFIETTFMHYGHGPGGIIGITLKPETLKTWTLGLHICCRLEQYIAEIVGGINVRDTHKEETKARIASDVFILIVIRYQASFFPVFCGHRKPIFTGTSSIPLRTILLSIDSGLPSLAGVQQLKDDVLRLFLNDVKEELQKRITTTTFECIFAGSIEEGYGVPYPYKKDFPMQLDALYADCDVMFCCESYNASFTRQGNILVEQLHITENALILPVYALLKTLAPTSSGDQLLDSYKFIVNVHEAVRSSKASHLPINAFWGLSITRHIQAYIKGPCVKVVVNPYLVCRRPHFEGDITLCIKCLEWPPSLSDWPTRKNRLWPSLEDVRRITSHGFHLVAKPCSYRKRHGNRHRAWRFSFSVAEVELSKLVSNTARKCFLALKVILKDHLQPVVPELSSYHAKTIFLNTLEKKPENFWVEEDIEECFHTLLKELHDALESKTCQHHWLIGVNLFDSISKFSALLMTYPYKRSWEKTGNAV